MTAITILHEQKKHTFSLICTVRIVEKIPISHTTSVLLLQSIRNIVVRVELNVILKMFSYGRGKAGSCSMEFNWKNYLLIHESVSTWLISQYIAHKSDPMRIFQMISLYWLQRKNKKKIIAAFLDSIFSNIFVVLNLFNCSNLLRIRKMLRMFYSFYYTEIQRCKELLQTENGRTTVSWKSIEAMQRLLGCDVLPFGISLPHRRRCISKFAAIFISSLVIMKSKLENWVK